MNYQSIIIIVTVIILAILIGHGLWSSRREKLQREQANKRFERNEPELTTEYVSAPRPVRKATVNSHADTLNSTKTDVAKENTVTTTAKEVTEKETIVSPTLDTTTVVDSDNIKVDIPSPQSNFEPQQHNLDLGDENLELEVSQIKIKLPGQEPVSAIPAPQPKTTAEPITETPADTSDNNENTTTTEIVAEESKNEPDVKEAEVETQTHQKDKREYLVIYVVAPENREFYGSRIVSSLENLGFIFGEHNIFHYHLDLNADSPITFSVANMRKPGIFDLSNMDQFSTNGLTFFMPLPSPGNNVVNFRTMYKKAETLSEELSGYLLNDRREIFTDETKQAYLAKAAE